MNMKCPTRENTVTEFHQKFNHDIDAPWTSKLLELRMKLIKEESNEVIEEFTSMIVDIERGKAVTAEQKSRLLKELCDLQYVLSGAAVALGLNEMQVAFTRVHNSNLSKLGLDGKPIYRKDGKVIKGPNYAPPELRDLV
jgi:predicted HAD superfamily Cof-like phosphohydrolase